MSHLDSATNFLDNCLALESGVTGFGKSFLATARENLRFPNGNSPMCRVGCR